MPYYKNKENKLWFVDVDQTFEQLVEMGAMEPDCVLITDEEANQITDAYNAKLAQSAPQPSIQDLQAQLATITAQINNLAGGK